MQLHFYPKMNKSKPVLYLSYDGMTDPLGQSQVLPYICGLSKLGYRFTLVSCEKPDRWQKHKKDIEAICLAHQIQWQPLVYHKSPPILSTVWDILQLHRQAFYWHTKKDFKLVHCRGYISALIGLTMQRRLGIKFIFDMRGLWADEKVDAGAWSLKHPIYKKVYHFFKRKEREFLLHADHTISLTLAGKREILSWDYMQERQNTMVVIPCCADTELFDFSKQDEETVEKWRQRLHIDKEDFVISYLGSIGTWYMLPEMLDFFKVWKQKYPRSKFLFITHDEHIKIRTEAERRGLLNDIIIQPGQRREVPNLLALSKASLFFIRPSYSKIASSPTKQAEIMAMGIPLICNAGVGDTDMLVEKYTAGYVVKEFNEQEYTDIIEKMCRENKDSYLLRRGALDYASLQQGVNQYSELYKKCWMHDT